jgi:hypothetical protein
MNYLIASALVIADFLPGKKNIDYVNEQQTRNAQQITRADSVLPPHSSGYDLSKKII